MINDFEKLRKKLHEAIETSGLHSEQTEKISIPIIKMKSNIVKIISCV